MTSKAISSSLKDINIIIKETSNYLNDGSVIREYIKGRFLGEVLILIIFRVDLQNAMNLKTLLQRNYSQLKLYLNPQYQMKTSKEK